jgi:DNA-binding CsgD family transcriptional regulator
MHMKETVIQRLFASGFLKSSGTFWDVKNRRLSIIIVSLLGAWIVCFPYEGQLLSSLAKIYGIESEVLQDISLVMQVVGLILGGLLLKTIKAARKLIIYAIPVCILCMVTFFFPSYTVWLITLTICSALAGICISSFGYFFKNFIKPGNGFRTVAEIIICINILKALINNISLYISIQTGFAFTILMLGAALYLTLKIPVTQDRKIDAGGFDKKAGFNALVLLFLFIAVFSIDFVIMTELINPKYSSSGWLASWYWLLPYLAAAFIMRSFKNNEDRSNVLYAAVGMIGIGFILFLTLNYTVSSYLIINTVMRAAWAVSDIFWWSILVEMSGMIKRPSVIVSVGTSGVMIGMLSGKILAFNAPMNSRANLSIVSMAVICVTLIILPILHKLLSKMIKKSKIVNIAEMNMIEFTDGINTLTGREKQIAALLLKGRTYKLIATELFLSENTVKTHIKSIYSKLGIKRKSELFNFKME